MSLIEAVLIEHGYVGGPIEEGDRWTKVLCPYHKESRPSASANPELGAFSCFACGMKGDCIALIMRKEGITFGDAKRELERIAHASGLELPESTTGQPNGNGIFDRRTRTNSRVNKTVRPRFRWGA